MHHDSHRAAGSVAATSASGRPLELPAWPLDARADAERRVVAQRARETDAGRQLQRCFPRWSGALEQLRLTALHRLAANQPVDPNDPDAWRGPDEHGQAVL